VSYHGLSSFSKLTCRQSLPAISQVTSASHDEFTKSDKVYVHLSLARGSKES
jgi:hypothetical protein